MNLTVVSGNVTFTLSQDTSGNLTGNATSVPPLCEFNVSVSGAVTSSGSFYLQTPDTTTASFKGTLTDNNQEGTGNVNLGTDTGCGPRAGGTFEIQLE